MADLRYFLICCIEKEGTGKDGKPTKFMTYFGYRQNMTENKETGVKTFDDILTPVTDENGNPDMVAKSVKVSMSDKFKAKVITANLNYPIIVALDKDKRVVGKDGKQVNSYFVTPDIDRDTKQPRLDKYGRRHLVVVINDAEIVCEKPRDSYDLDDIETFE